MEKQLSLGPTEKCNIVVIFLEHITGMSNGWVKTFVIDMFSVELNVLHYFEPFRDRAIDDHRQKIPGSQNAINEPGQVCGREHLEPTRLSEQLYCLGKVHAK